MALAVVAVVALPQVWIVLAAGAGAADRTGHVLVTRTPCASSASGWPVAAPATRSVQ